MTTVKWNGKQVENAILEGMQKNLDRARFTVSRHAKKKVSVAYPPAGPKRGYPAKRTGFLRRDITSERQGLIARVGTNLKPYPKMLETGTKKMTRRPWLSLTIQETMGQVKKLLSRPIK